MNRAMASRRPSSPENRSKKEGLFALIDDESSEDDRREMQLRRRRKAARANARAAAIEQGGVVKAPVGKGRRRWTRPIFKEPGSKMGTPEVVNEIKEPQPPKRVPIIEDIRGECQKMMVKKGDFDTIEPRNTTNERLRNIVSRTAAQDQPGKQGAFDTSKYLNRREDTVDRDAHRSLDTPVKLQRTTSDMSYIRREVNKMMNHILPEQPQPRLPPNDDGRASNKYSRKLAEHKESRDARDEWRPPMSMW